MTCSDGEAEQQWIKILKLGGAVPYLEPENCTNGWATPPGDSFMVRGPEYLANKVKIPGGEYLLKPLGFDWIKGPAKICEILNDKNHRVRKAIDEEVSHGNQPFVWAFNLQLPKDNYSAIFYFVSLEPIPEGSLMDQFLKGDDAFRKSRLKLIANVVKGPWIVRTAVGDQAICILGRALSCKYIQGSNFIEVDVDIGSSIVANAIVHLAFGYVTTLTVDLAFLIESQTESELPERLLGAVRFSELAPGSAGLYKMPSEEHQEGDQAPPTGFWHGFSQLLNNPGNPKEPSPNSQNTNGNLQTEDVKENKWKQTVVWSRNSSNSFRSIDKSLLASQILNSQVFFFHFQIFNVILRRQPNQLAASLCWYHTVISPNLMAELMSMFDETLSCSIMQYSTSLADTLEPHTRRHWNHIFIDWVNLDYCVPIRWGLFVRPMHQL